MNPPIDYTTLSLGEVATALDEVARDVETTFGRLDARRLNWRPDATRWSVAQCLDHLLAANQQMLAAADRGLDLNQPRTIWERLPVWPRLFGAMLIRSQAPGGSRKYTAPQAATPASSAIDGDIIHRFVAAHVAAVRRVRALDERQADAAIMTSPFVRAITYSVLDGLRLLVAHDHRHVEQARRVTQAPGFPSA